jgi:hypothetical protein
MEPPVIPEGSRHCGGLSSSAPATPQRRQAAQSRQYQPRCGGAQPARNGRVARLVSHASLLDLLDTAGIWSVARGLARNVATYKEHLANCDLPRRNDLDGRGNLSEEALAALSRFFLETCLDQVSFMESLVQPDRLRTRILLWAEEEIRFGNLASTEVGKYSRGGSLLRRAAPWRRGRDRRNRGQASTSPCLKPLGEASADIRKFALAAALGLSRVTGPTMDARVVPGKSSDARPESEPPRPSADLTGELILLEPP